MAKLYGISERSLERHLRNIANGVCAISSEASADEETPPTSRSPVFEPVSGVRLVTIDVDDRAVASFVLSELVDARQGLVAAFESAIADLDKSIASWRAIAQPLPVSA